MGDVGILLDVTWNGMSLDVMIVGNAMIHGMSDVMMS